MSVKSSAWSEEKEKNSSQVFDAVSAVKKERCVCEREKETEISLAVRHTQEKINLEFSSWYIFWILQT